MTALPKFRRAALMLVPSAALLLTACGGAESKLRNGLISAGLSQPMAACMAKPMAQQLSINQLRKLNSLSKVGNLDPRKTSYDKMIHHVRALGDPEILRIATSAAVNCAIGI
jgi:hypothetical protein